MLQKILVMNVNVIKDFIIIRIQIYIQDQLLLVCLVIIPVNLA